MSKEMNAGGPGTKASRRVVVIMSAYNAEKYLAEQIDSILGQHGADVRLYVRDDGSRDRTREILSRYTREDGRVRFDAGRNLGAMNSFMHALFDCPFEGDYYGFADADDVWVPDKLAYTIDLLEGTVASVGHTGGPAAVSTKLRVVDERLAPMGETATPRLGLSFENALIDTVASGASILMNPAAFSLLREFRPTRAVMHDAWAYLLITAFGEFRYGDRPTILYRQHASNVIGTAHGWKRRLAVRWRRFRTPNPYWAQAVEFATQFGPRLDPEKRRVLDAYVGYRRSLSTRLRFALSPSVRPQSRKADALYRLLFLLGRG